MILSIILGLNVLFNSIIKSSKNYDILGEESVRTKILSSVLPIFIGGV